MKTVLVANWKENPENERKALALFKATAQAARGANVNVVICPPFIHVEKIAAARRPSSMKNVILGAQDVFWEEKGAHTSEVGPKMLKRLGLQYVIVGHSERRRELGETDAIVNKKVKAALRDGITVILCVGEPLSVRKKGVKASERYVFGQLKKDLKGISGLLTNYHVSQKHLLVAYEPIWAIGTGSSDSPEDARAMAICIKKTVPGVTVLYGGSVDSKNVLDYVSLRDIGGALIGGASLKASVFATMITRVAKK